MAEPQTNHPPELIIAGPTASGKSAVALELAEALGGEIISVDSMQVYRGLDIGTAKPSPEERQRAPHHLIDAVDLREHFDAARFVELAGRAREEILGKGRVPIFCGGTGLYLKVFFEGIGEAPPADPVLRAELSSTPTELLLRELQSADPATYEKIDRNNPRRIIRAVEVIRLTGKPFSELRASWRKDADPASHRVWIGLSRAPEDLRRRIDRRVEQMFEQGLVEETRVALNHGLSTDSTAMQSLGYRQVVEYLRGERSLDATMELVKVRTRQFAKRQMTWFRRQAALRWIALEEEADAVQVAGEIGAIHLPSNWRQP
jgi:tRNA dimethylallyltransferase